MTKCIDALFRYMSTRLQTA